MAAQQRASRVVSLLDLGGALSTVGDGETDDIFINVSPASVTVWVQGEIDVANLERFTRWLEPLRGIDTDVHLRLQGLRFISLRGTSFLVDLAAAQDLGHRLFLHQPPYGMRLMLTRLWPTSRLVVVPVEESVAPDVPVVRQRDARGETLT